MVLTPIEVVDIGLDWSTFTSRVRDSGMALASVAENYLRSERERGNNLSPWSMSGYEGFKCGQIASGMRDDSIIARLSGAMSQTEWRHFYDKAQGCSRIDLQVTYRYTQEASAVVTSTYRGVTNHRRRIRHGPTVSIWKEAGGSATIYFGKRVSERYGRIYDKGLESGMDHYKNCVRYELEVKGKLSWSMINELAHQCPSTDRTSPTSSEQALIHSWLRYYFEQQGVSLGLAPAGSALLRSARAYTDSHTQLEWLRTQVKPTVERLRSMGFARDAYDILFQHGVGCDRTSTPYEISGRLVHAGPVDTSIDDIGGDEYGD